MFENKVVRKITATDEAEIFALYKKVAVEDGGIARSEAEITEGYVHNFVARSVSDGLGSPARSPDLTCANLVPVAIRRAAVTLA